MYIEEVINRADELCLNNEYPREMKYHWCDVVGGELMSMVKPQYARVKLDKWQDGIFMLPEGVRYENVVSVIANGREIPKKDMRTQGYWIIYGVRERFFLEDRGMSASSIDVIYLKDYKKIRRFTEEAMFTFRSREGKTYAETSSIELPVVAGDVLDVAICRSETGDISGKINVLERDIRVSGKDYTLVLDITSDFEVQIPINKEYPTKLTRIVTDETVCSSPWDEMYIDYICGQICFYQRDMAEYQQFMARYNSRIKEYRSFIKMNEPSDDGQLYNWW